MLNRRHIKAPRTFNPKGPAPREQLAYLSRAEMEMLRQLTDGTISIGPHGIPSFSVTTGKTTGTTSSGPGGGTGPGAGMGSNQGGNAGYTNTNAATNGKNPGAANATGGKGGTSSPSSGTTKSSASTTGSAVSGNKVGTATAAAKASTSATATSTKSTGPSTSLNAPARTAPSTSSPGAANQTGGKNQGPTGGLGSIASPSAAYNTPTAPTTSKGGEKKTNVASPMAGQGTSYKTPAAAMTANKNVVNSTNTPSISKTVTDTRGLVDPGSSLPTGTGENPAYRNPNYGYPSLARFSPNGTIMPTQGKVYPSGVHILDSEPKFDQNILAPAGQDIYRALANAAIDAQQPVKFFSGKEGRSAKTPQHPAGVAIDTHMVDPTTGKPYMGVTRPIGNKKLAPGYREYANNVIEGIYRDPGNYPNLNPKEVRWGGNFGGRFPRDYMHFDAGQIVKGNKVRDLPNNKTQTAWNTAGRIRAANPVDQGINWNKPTAVAVSEPSGIPRIAENVAKTIQTLDPGMNAIRLASLAAPSVPSSTQGLQTASTGPTVKPRPKPADNGAYNPLTSVAPSQYVAPPNALPRQKPADNGAYDPLSSVYDTPYVAPPNAIPRMRPEDLAGPYDPLSSVRETPYVAPPNQKPRQRPAGLTGPYDPLSSVSVPNYVAPPNQKPRQKPADNGSYDPLGSVRSEIPQPPAPAYRPEDSMRPPLANVPYQPEQSMRPPLAQVPYQPEKSMRPPLASVPYSPEQSMQPPLAQVPYSPESSMRPPLADVPYRPENSIRRPSVMQDQVAEGPSQASPFAEGLGRLIQSPIQTLGNLVNSIPTEDQVANAASNLYASLPPEARTGLGLVSAFPGLANTKAAQEATKQAIGDAFRSGIAGLNNAITSSMPSVSDVVGDGYSYPETSAPSASPSIQQSSPWTTQSADTPQQTQRPSSRSRAMDRSSNDNAAMRRQLLLQALINRGAPQTATRSKGQTASAPVDYTPTPTGAPVVSSGYTELTDAERAAVLRQLLGENWS